MVFPSLAEFTLAVCLALVPGKDHRELAGAIAAAVESHPEAFFKNDQDEMVDDVLLPARSKSAALMAAVSFRESGLHPRQVGDCPGMAAGDLTCTVAKGAWSFGAFQIALPYGHKGAVTGLTGVKLLEDPAAQAREAVHILWYSVHACPDFPVAVYAHGRDPRVACADLRSQRISNDRMWLARKVRRDAAKLIPTMERKPAEWWDTRVTNR
jgi:hypothetical protein